MIGLQVFDDSSYTRVLADWTSRALRVMPETDEHGFAYLPFFVPLSIGEAFRFYDLLPTAHVVLSEYGHTIFEGRIEDRRPVPGGLEVGAFGYSNALRDAPYTGLFSTTRYLNWITVTDQLSNRTPEKYHIDNNNRLFVGLRKNETYTDAVDVAEIYFELPSQGQRSFNYIEYDYDISLPTSWVARLRSFDTGFSGATVEKTYSGTTSGTETITSMAGSNKEILAFQVFYNAGSGSDNYTGETGASYMKITNIRLSTAGATVPAKDVADALVTFINGINSAQLDSSLALIDSPAVDLNEAVYEDRFPADILTELANQGDNNSPPERFEWGVWEGQKLHFRQRGSAGRDWYIDIGDLDVTSTLDTLFNSAYAVYRDEKGVTTRTAVSGDTPSQTRYSITRRTSVRAATTSDTTAQTYRDTLIEARKDITPRARIVVDRLFTDTGAIAPLYLARSGDTVTIRNLPPTAGTSVDKIRKFTIARTRLDVDGRLLELTPELDAPDIENLVAQALRTRTSEYDASRPPVTYDAAGELIW